jgi:hypothetical protein
MNIYSRSTPPNGFYVYAYLRNDETPYYIGKGKGVRAWKPHLRQNGTNLLPNEDRIRILAHGLSDNEAKLLEKTLISSFGRADLGEGILRNLTNGGDGTSGAKISEKTLTKKSIALKGKKTGPHSTERKANISKGRKGIPAKNKGKPMPKHQLELINQKAQCPHCSKIGPIGPMTRWHFDNCKTLN